MLRTNELGAERGLRLRYDRTAVVPWLSGTRPCPLAPELIAEAFTCRLGRRITVADTELGLRNSPRGGAPTFRPN